MKKKSFRILTLCLAAILLLGALAGCGKKQGNQDDPNSGGQKETPEFVYVPEYVTPDGDVGRINQCFGVGDKIYFTSSVATGTIQELYPNDSEKDPWYFSIDGEVIHAEKLDYGGGGMVIYDDVAIEPTPVATAAPTVMSAPAALPEAEPETEQEPEELSEYEAERKAAIEQYIQYDENGELIVPDGYEFYEYDKTETVLMRMDVDGRNVTRLENYALPKPGEDMESDGSLNTMMGDRDGRLWVSEQVYSYSYDKDTGEYIDGGEQSYLRQLDETGAEVRRVSLDKVKAASENEWFYVQTIAIDGEDNVYVLCDGAIYVVDLDGSVLFKLSSDDWINSMLTMGDGRVAAVMYENDGQKLKYIDPAKKGWGDSYKAPTSMYNCLPGSGDYDLYYNDGISLYGYSVEKGEGEEIVNWLNADINGDYVRGIVPLADGRVVVMLYNWNFGGPRTSNTEMAILSKQPYSVLGDKTILTLACLNDYEIRDRVIEFNKKSDKYRIEVKNYSVFNNYESENEEDHNAGLTKLNTEIISGTVPDILALDGLPAQQYMAKGLLEDLYPFIDGDPEISREKLVMNVVDKAAFSGKLYQTVKSFYVQTIVCPKSVVGDISGWTPSEMRQFQSKMPPDSAIFKDMTKESVLQMMLMYNGSEFINWETGKCSFNSQGFVDLLEYANTFPAEIDWENYEYEYVPELVRLQEGTMLGIQLGISDMNEFLAYKSMFGGEIAVVGFPCESREGNLLTINGGLAMSSKCADKDAAWQFLRQDFLARGENDRYSYGMSVNRADLDAMIEQFTQKVYEKDENGKPVLQPINSWWMDDGKEGQEIKIMPAEQADVDQFMAIIDSAKPVSGYDQDVYNLVSAEVQAFFSGQKSARDVANVVQSKMQTYVNEHM